jgi:NAD(P)-dependent dehydrogenase (short-subunit alcohol dehydrogenase family)
MTGKTAFVTGAASGIGLALVGALLDRGMQVVAADIDGDTLALALEPLGVESERLFPIVLDVSDRSAYAAARERVTRRFGTIYLLCNNAGVGGSASIDRAGYADWDWILGVNLGGVINGLVTFLPDMVAQGAGHIVNTASITALVPQPGPVALYSVSKQAVLALSETLHATLADKGIGVSVICPGFVATGIARSEAVRPDRFASGIPRDPAAEAGFDQLVQQGMAPEAVAEQIVAAIDARQLYVLTHPEFRPAIERRFQALLNALPAGPPHAEAVPAARQQAADAMLADLMARVPPSPLPEPGK